MEGNNNKAFQKRGLLFCTQLLLLYQSPLSVLLRGISMSYIHPIHGPINTSCLLGSVSKRLQFFTVSRIKLVGKKSCTNVRFWHIGKNRVWWLEREMKVEGHRLWLKWCVGECVLFVFSGWLGKNQCQRVHRVTMGKVCYVSSARWTGSSILQKSTGVGAGEDGGRM